jgi:thiamine-monophosphate kinase
MPTNERVTVGDVGERRLIQRFQRLITKSPKALLKGSEDAAAVEYDGQVIVANTDMLVASTDILPSMTSEEISWKAGVMGLSDLAAKGAIPLGILVSFGFPKEVEKDYVEALVIGLNYVCRKHDTYYLGGDTNQCAELVINCTAIGTSHPEQLLHRSGAKPGDIVAVTGKFGYTGALFKIVLERRIASKRLVNRIRSKALFPQARLKEGHILASTGVASASIDSSDGLAWSLHELALASKVGFQIDQLPIPQTCIKFAEQHKLDVHELALYGGEEYELVVTIPQSQWNTATQVVQRTGGQLLRIGSVTKESENILTIDSKERKIEPRGYEHFK